MTGDSVKCPHCIGTGFIDMAIAEKRGKKVFERWMAELLIMATKFANDREITIKADRANPKSARMQVVIKNAVLSNDLKLAGHVTEYTRIGDLKHWGLLHQDEAWWHQGAYQLTNKAAQFIAGLCSIPREVIVSGGYVIKESADQILFQTALGNRYQDYALYIAQWREKSIPNIQTEGEGQLKMF